MESRKGKLAIIGLDGASFNILNQFLDNLPFLKNLILEGSSGDLLSVDPPVTFGAWTTIFSSLNPGRHGCHNSVKLTEDYKIAPYPADAGYRIYDDFNKPILVNLPASFPRQPKHGGYIIHSWLCPSKVQAFPEALQGWDEYSNYLFGEVSSNALQKLYYPSIIAKFRKIEKRRFDLTRKLFMRKDFDLFFTLFNTPDWALHELSKTFYPLTKAMSVLESLWLDIDEYIGWFVDHFDNLLIFSDHGFQRIDKVVFLNSYLQNEGFVSLKKDANPLRLGESYIKKIDFEQTSAFAFDPYGSIYLNDERYEKGVILVEDRLEYQVRVKEKLNALNKEYGGGLFEDVLFKERLYHGSKLVSLPDIFIRWKPNVSADFSTFNKYQFVVPARDATPYRIGPFRAETYLHRREGLWIAHGEDFMNGLSFDAKIEDIGPTVLSLFDIKPSEILDGSIMKILR